MQYIPLLSLFHRTWAMKWEVSIYTSCTYFANVIMITSSIFVMR